MSSLSQFGGGNRVPRALINSTSTTGSAADAVNTAGVLAVGCKKTVTGALTANVLVDVFNVTNLGGVLCFASCYGQDATSRTHRFKLTLDGVVVYDATTAAVATTGRGIQLVGTNSGGSGITQDAIPFNTSCRLEYASSLSETGLTNFAYLYRTN